MTFLGLLVGLVLMGTAGFARTPAYRRGYDLGLHGGSVPPGLGHTEWQEVSRGYRDGFAVNLRQHGFRP